MADGAVDLKVVFLGDSGVGKSCLLLRYLTNRFGYTESTIGASFAQKVVQVDSHTLNVGFWDTAGQERFHSLSPLYCRGAGTCIFVFDLTSRSSLESIPKWNDMFSSSKPSELGYFTMLVGAKADLVEDGSHTMEVKEAEIEAMRAQIGAHAYVKTSALTGDNVAELFEEVVREFNRIRGVSGSGGGGRRGVSVEGGGGAKEKKSCC